MRCTVGPGSCQECGLKDRLQSNKCTSIKSRNEIEICFLKGSKPQVLNAAARIEDIMKRLICVSLFTAATMLAQTNTQPNAQPPTQAPAQPGQPSTPGQPPSPTS